MFKFYGNENLASIIVDKLRELGYDVLTSYEAGNANQGIPDLEVLGYATADHRIVISFNLDDFVYCIEVVLTMLELSSVRTIAIMSIEFESFMLTCWNKTY